MKKNQTHLWWKGLPGLPSPAPCSDQVQLEHAAQGLVQLVLHISKTADFVGGLCTLSSVWSPLYWKRHFPASQTFPCSNFYPLLLVLPPYMTGIALSRSSPYLPIRWAVVDCNKLCHWPDKKNHSRFKWYWWESTILASYIKARSYLTVTPVFLRWNKPASFNLPSYCTCSTMSVLPLVLGSSELDVVLQMLSHKCQPEGKNHFCSLLVTFLVPAQHAAGHHYWLLFNSLSTRTPMAFPTKVLCRQLVPACTVAWCYPGPDAGLGIAAFVGLHKLPVRSPFWPVPLSSSPVLQRIRHSPSLALFTHLLNVLVHHPRNSSDALYQSLRDTTANWLLLDFVPLITIPEPNRQVHFLPTLLFTYPVHILWFSYKDTMGDHVGGLAKVEIRSTCYFLF